MRTTRRETILASGGRMLGEAASRGAVLVVLASAALAACRSSPAEAPASSAVFALAEAPYCEQTDGALGFPVYGCDGLTDDPCEVVGCFDNLCRRGKLFPGCCSADEACDDSTRFDVCNSFQGRCVPFADAEVGFCDYGPDADHPGCCGTNTDCVRRMLEGEVLDNSGPACASDADCQGSGALGSVCRQGRCVARCEPDACLATGCSAEGLAIATYPEYQGVCDKMSPRCPDGACGPEAWYACVYEPRPALCAIPYDVPPLRFSELMVAPVTADDAVGEWIELLPTGRFNLAGWYVGVGTGSEALTAKNRIDAPDDCLAIEGGRLIVLCRGSSDPAVNGNVPCDVVMPSDAWALDDAGATISLWAPGGGGTPGTLVDSVTYSVAAVAEGVSLALSHPYATAWGHDAWFTEGLVERRFYNDLDRGTPGQLNLDIVDDEVLDPASSGYLDTCGDGKRCTLNLCGFTSQGYCTAYGLAGCDGGPVGCDTDLDCQSYYPPDLDLSFDVVEPIGEIDAADGVAIRARFDEVTRKLCVQHACQARKRMEAADGCIAADYPRADLDCDDHSPCTRNQCLCTADDPALRSPGEGGCADGDGSNGYFACDYATPVDLADTCCRSNDDCPDDGDPSTDAVCQGYRCVHEVPPCWCEGPEDCTAATVCEVAGCIPCQACTYELDPAKPGCCASHQDCVKQEIAAEGRDLANTLNVCCADSARALGDRTELDALCAGNGVGAGYPTCDVVTGPGFCQTVVDCVPGPGQRCLSVCCVAHQCRFGPPGRDGDPTTPGFEECCEPSTDSGANANPPCNDHDLCTLDACTTVPSTGLGACSHAADPSKPGCCRTSDDCPAGEGACDQPICSFDASAGYSTCASVDLVALGFCCQADGDCDDGDPCTAQMCLDHSCRFWKPDEACCTTTFDCPPTGDACTWRTCSMSDGVGACTLVALPNCMVNLPYKQDFELEHAFYDAAFDHVALIGWSVTGSDPAAWQPSAAPILGHAASRHLRFAPSHDVALDEGAYVELPRLNTTGMDQIAATLVFRHALDLVDGSPQGLTLAVQARKSGSAPWQTVGSSVALETSVAETAATVTLPASVLGSPDMRVRFSLKGPGLAAGSAWTLDDVVLARGRPPTLETPLFDSVVPKGTDLRLERLDAWDAELDTVSFELVAAPGFLSLVDPYMASQDSVPHTYADLRVIDAACDGSGAPSSVYPVAVRVSDPWLAIERRFDLTVTGCAE